MSSITLHNMKNIGAKVWKILDSYKANTESPRPNGVKQFEVGEQTVWALNTKNEIRKAKLYSDLKIIGG